MSFIVKCNDRSECPAVADAPTPVDELSHAEEDMLRLGRQIALVGLPSGWTSNRGLGGKWEHYCPLHPQPEISGG